MIDLHLSTIGADASAMAREHGLGIEIAEFSYAVNIDTDFPYWEEVTRANLLGIERRVFHAPHNELCPAAIDPLIVEVTRTRLEQAYKLTNHFGINRMVVHSGFIPNIYFRSWFVEHSVEFWRNILLDKPPDFTLLLENVFEEGPEMLLEIIEEVGDSRFRVCLDIGHAGGAFSDTSITSWIKTSAPFLDHVHIHNNYLAKDTHNPPAEGLINMRAAIDMIIELRPEVTFTAETADLRSAISWFEACGYVSL